MGSTFDPDQAGATLEYTDGITTVAANWLSANTPRVASVVDACKAVEGAADGAHVDVVDVSGLQPGATIADVSGASVAGIAYDANGRYLFRRQNSTFTIETVDLEDLTVVSPAREFSLSWAAGGVLEVWANSEYLVVTSATNIDVFDLSDDSLVDTFVPTGNLLRSVLVRGNRLAFVTDEGTNGTLYMLDLATAALDGDHTPLELNDSQGNVRLAADDQLIYVVNDSGEDEIEAVDYAGASVWTAAGVGSGTTIEDIAADGQGYFYILNGAYVGKYRGWRAFDQIEERLHLVAGGDGIDCDGRYVWVVSTSDDSHLLATTPGLPVVAIIPTSDLRQPVFTYMDGMDLVFDYDDGGGTEGFRKVRGAAIHRRFRKADEDWWGSMPHRAVAVPVD